MRKIRVILPAYNEEDSLPNLLFRLDKAFREYNLNMEVLVVNDGSTDNTPIIAQNFNGGIKVKLLDLQPNRGLAGAIREGLKEGVKDLDFEDIVITMDADDSQSPFLILNMVNHIREGSDVVIASRYQIGSRIVGLTKFRKATSIGAGLLFRLVVGLEGVKDYTCGFRAYRVEVLNKAMHHYDNKFIEQQGFGCMAEVLLKLKRFNPIIRETPMILRYDQKLGASKMKVLKTIRQTLSLLYSHILRNN